MNLWDILVFMISLFFHYTPDRNPLSTLLFVHKEITLLIPALDADCFRHWWVVCVLGFF